jgi:PAS domain S-box-containing protein
MREEITVANEAGPRLRSVSAAFWDWDLLTGRMEWSGALDELRSCAALLGEDAAAWGARVRRADRAARRAAIERAIDGGGDRWSCSYCVVCDDGRERAVLERANVVRTGAVAVRAVGELRVADSPAEADAAALADRMAPTAPELRTFVDSLPQLAWSTDENGWIDYYNRRWFEYTGSTMEQMEGWGWVNVHDPELLPRMLRIWRNALVAGQPWEDEFRLRRGSDGALRWHLSRAMPVRDAAGRIVRWFGTNTDIEDQKLAAEQYVRLLAREQRARREAELANRAKDEFLALVSHELRTPLSAVLGWAQLLRAGSLTPAKQAAAVEKIERNARLQATLIEDLLDVGRILSGKLELDRRPVDVGAAVRAAVEAASPAAKEKRLSLTFADRSGGTVAWADATRLRQIVGNLLANAIKFTPAGGSVGVLATVSGEHAEIEVRDDGQGIAPELLPHVFERFRQADTSSVRRHGGLGLGLSIVRQLVDLHGGEVSAASEGDGKGATFRVRLPLLAAEADRERASTPPPAGEEEPASLAGVKVLAVDDEASARDVLAAALLSCGATVTLAGSVHEALRAFKLDRPDVVVSDIAMPEVDGYGLVEKIRQLPDPASARTPIIALTAYASLQDRQRALRAGFDQHLPKPIDYARLSRVISEVARARLLSG